MPTAYVAQRLDFDEPLWGFQVRDSARGWLRGFITLTTFTTWSADFEWDSDSAESGLPAARLWNARLRNGEDLMRLRLDPGVYVAEKDGETLTQVAAKHGVKCADVVALNREQYKNINGFSKVMAGTELMVYPEEESDLDRSSLPTDTPRAVAQRHGLPLDALVSINRERFGDQLHADTRIGCAKPMKLRDRDREVSFEYLNPAVALPASSSSFCKQSAASSSHSTNSAYEPAPGCRGGAKRQATEELPAKEGTRRTRHSSEAIELPSKAIQKSSSATQKAAAPPEPPSKRARLAERGNPSVLQGQHPKGKAKVGASASHRATTGAEPMVYGMRKVDEDGALTRLLAQQEHEGDPTKEGVVWPRVAELGLLVSLGGGGTLLRFSLQHLQAEGWYHFVVCQATLAAVGFYERLGFIRVGAVAKYAEKGVTEEELRALPVTGYRHWAEADELMLDADFGDASYLMGLDLRVWDGGALLDLPTTSDFPEISKMPKASRDLRRIDHECVLEGGQLAYESGDGVVVSLMAEMVAGELNDLRMEIRYEVESILAHRGSGASLEYEVKWAKWRETTWEPAKHMEGAAEALKAYHDKN